MKITDFTKEITSYEGKKKNVDIAQIGEILRIVNELTSGEMYKIIRNRPVPVLKATGKVSKVPANKVSSSKK